MQLKDSSIRHNPMEFVDLYRYWTIVKKHRTVALTVFILFLLLSGLAAVKAKRIYQAEGLLLLKKQTANSNLTSVGKEIGDTESVGRLGDPVDTEKEIISSEPLILQTIGDLKLKDNDGKSLSVEDFLKNLKIATTRGTDVLAVNYRSDESDLAAAVVNTLMRLYVENNIQINRAEARTAREFIEKQLPRSNKTVENAGNALRRFKEENQITNVDNESQSVADILATTEKRIIEIQTALGSAETESKVLQDKLGMNAQMAFSSNALSQSSGVQQALKDLQNLEGQLALERTRFQDSSPVVVNLQDRLDAVKSLLQERVQQVLESSQSNTGNLQFGELQQKITEQLIEAEVNRYSLDNQLSILTRQYSLYKQRANSIPTLWEKERQLQQTLSAEETGYESLLKTLQEVRVAEQQNLGNVRILQPARIPEKPILPKVNLIIAAGFASGVLTALGVIFLLEYKNTSVKSINDAKELLGYPLLASIPTFDSDSSYKKSSGKGASSSLLVRDYPRSRIAEAYRTLFTTMKFMNLGKDLKVFTITSSVPKEGKSTVSANLATAAAESQKVLLVDADMRRPSQQEIWKIPNKVGLSNLLLEELEISDVVQRVMPNLHVITAGAVPFNPAVLLNSEQMISLIKNFANGYDFVIIDTPPVIVASDSTILGKLSDALLMVVRPEVAQANTILQAKLTLDQLLQDNILGQIVNGCLPDDSSDSYSNYYYESYHNNEENNLTLNDNLSKNLSNSRRTSDRS